MKCWVKKKIYTIFIGIGISTLLIKKTEAVFKRRLSIQILTNTLVYNIFSFALHKAYII